MQLEVQNSFFHCSRLSLTLPLNPRLSETVVLVVANKLAAYPVF